MKDCIAIDGLSSTGKSTVGKIISKELNYLYLDTGAMYRVITAYCLKNKIDFFNEDEFQKNKKNINIVFKSDSSIYCNDDDYTDIIRTKDICDKVSIVASIPHIRKFLVDQQKKIAEKFNVVMEGRDIGTNVVPFAKNKFFLICDDDVRAKRRYNENLKKNILCTLQDVKENLKKRDFIDMTRKINPLKKAIDAVEIDTTYLTTQEVVNLMLNVIKK